MSGGKAVKLQVVGARQDMFFQLVPQFLAAVFGKTPGGAVQVGGQGTGLGECLEGHVPLPPSRCTAPVKALNSVRLASSSSLPLSVIA